jgi:hypothetical protein
VQREWQKYRNFVEESQQALNLFDFLVYIGMPNPRDFGALDYEVKAFLRKTYNRKMEKLEAEKNK